MQSHREIQTESCGGSWERRSVSQSPNSGRSRRGAMLLIVTEDYKLLLRHRDNIPGITHTGCWAGFGGAIEGEESVEQALIREMKEETGLEIQDAIFLTDEIDHQGDGILIRCSMYSEASIRKTSICKKELASAYLELKSSLH
jgi:8-oxo-dGTP pyrophosphatase MutT (NUDIX family)